MKHCLVFACLISPSKMILFEKKYQTFDTVFHYQMKHLEVLQKYSAARRIFNSLLGVSSGDETLHLMFDILLIIWLRFKCRENCSYAKTITPKVYQIVCKKKLKNCSRTIVIFLVYNHLWSYLQVTSLVRTKIKVKLPSHEV